MHVGVYYDLGEQFEQRLRSQFPQVTFTAAYSEHEQKQIAPELDIIFGTLRREAFLVAKKLRWFHFIGVGFDSVLRRVPEFAASGVVMTNARGTHVIPMSEYTIGMMLAMAHQLRENLEDQRAHRWRTEHYRGHISELAGSSVGIIAFGDTGRAIARLALAFDMRVRAVDLAPVPAPRGVTAVWPMERLGDMLSLTDWLVVTAPRTAATANMIDAEQLAQLRPGARVIVVSRGGIVNEDALVASLDAGHLSGAAVDATYEEPPAPESPLWDHPRMYLTPHVSAETAQLLERRGQIFIDNLARFTAGESLLSVCDLERGY